MEAEKDRRETQGKGAGDTEIRETHTERRETDREGRSTHGEEGDRERGDTEREREVGDREKGDRERERGGELSLIHI